MLEKVAVFFDVDDTLLDNYNAFKCTLEESLPGFSEEEEFLKKLYQKFRHHSEEIYNKYREDPTNNAHEYNRWKLIQDMIGQSNQIQSIDLDDCYHKWQSRQLLSPEMTVLLTTLKSSNILSGILTNGFVQHQQNKLDQLELHQFIEPKWQFISEKLGDAKPNVSCFHKVEEQLPPEITKIYYVGDSYRNDIAPSYAAKWQPIWLNRFSDKGGLVVPQATSSEEVVSLLLSELLHFGK